MFEFIRLSKTRLSTTLPLEPTLSGQIFDVSGQLNPAIQVLIDNMREGVLLTDPKGTILAINSAFSQVTGYSKADVIGKSPRLLHSGHHDRAFYRQMWRSILRQGYWSGEIRNRRKDGSIYPEHLTISAIKDRQDATIVYMGVFTDITQQKLSEEKLLNLAYHDSLTGLPNRLLCLDRLQQALAHAKRHNCLVAVLFLDLDNFKPINDKLGHHAGDLLLQEVANRLQAFIRAEDTVARLSGDEFVVVLVDIPNRDHAVKVAKEIFASLRQPFQISGHSVALSTSMGMSVFPEDGQEPEALLEIADKAMYAAKARSKNRIMNRDTLSPT